MTREPKREGDRGATLPAGSVRQAVLGESCHGVRPGLDIRPDCVIRVRSDGDPVAAEVHHVDLAVGVMALQGRGEAILPEVVDHGSAVGRADRSSGEHRSHTGIELGQRVELVAARANGLGLGVLVDELGGVCLLGLLDRVMGHTAGHIRYTLKGIVVDDRLDDRVERRDIRNGFCKGADCTLDICTLYEICHTFLPPLGPWAE